MIRLLITRPAGSETFSSGRTELLLGRREGADLVTDERAASRNHCILRVQGARVQLLDLGSVNGTLVAGKRIEQVDLERGQCFRIGATEFRLEDFAGASGLSLEAPATTAPADSAPAGGEALPGAAPVSRGMEPSFAREIRALLNQTPWYMISLVVHALILFVLNLFMTDVRHHSLQGRFEAGLAEDLAPVDDGGLNPEAEPEIDLSQPEPEPLMPDDPADPAEQKARSNLPIDSDEPYERPEEMGLGAGLATRIKPLSISKVVKEGAKALDKGDLEGEAERAKETVSRGLGDGLGRLAGLSADKIVVIEGNFDKMELVLDLYGIRHSTMKRGRLLDGPLPTAKVLCINCASRGAPEEAKKYGEKIKSYVARGGWVITSDWAAEPYLTHAWPDIVQTVQSKRRQADTTVTVHAADTTSPILRGVFPGRTDVRWWLEESSTLLQVDERRALVLVSSDDMLQRFGSSVVVTEFQPERNGGKVLHLLGHFYQKDGNRVGLVAMHRLILNFLRMRFEE